MKTTSKVKQITIMGMLAALILIFSFTPIGSIPVGPLVITLNVIPVALAGIVLGSVGGAVMGGFFGIMSFLQACGIGVPSSLGSALFAINPFFSFIMCFVPRLLTGLIVGTAHKAMKKKINVYVSSSLTGFLTAFLNTLFFMSALMLLFGNTEKIQELRGGQNVLLFICSFVGLNAVVEWIGTTIITGAVGSALYKSKLISK